MALFPPAFDYCMTNEDYASTDPRYGQVHTDSDGGLVRFGINSKSLGKALIGTTFYTDMSVSEALVVAQNLYQTTVWSALRGDSINSQRVASKLFDMGVNQGQVEASKLCQRAVNVNVDGAIGPLTISAINSEDENIVLKGLIYWWQWFIEQVINNNPEDKPYEDAWTARAEKLPA